MLTEGELSMVEDSDRVRELQDRIGDLKAEVLWNCKLTIWLKSDYVHLKPHYDSIFLFHFDRYKD